LVVSDFDMVLMNTRNTFTNCHKATHRVAVCVWGAVCKKYYTWQI